MLMSAFAPHTPSCQAGACAFVQHPVCMPLDAPLITSIPISRSAEGQRCGKRPRAAPAAFHQGEPSFTQSHPSVAFPWCSVFVSLPQNPAPPRAGDNLGSRGGGCSGCHGDRRAVPLQGLNVKWHDSELSGPGQ